ncbi:hypothetical protein BJX99DRAFT_261606 [Aspergillus californicus]
MGKPQAQHENQIPTIGAVAQLVARATPDRKVVLGGQALTAETKLASGIGLGTVESLVQKGWNVAILDVNDSSGAEAASKHGDQVSYLHTNVASYDEQAKSFNRIYQKWGRIDFVYANAGILDRSNFVAPEEEFAYGAPRQPDTLVLDVNLVGVVWSSYLALHYFRKNGVQGGKLVMTSSSAGIYAIPEISLYAATKHAIIGLARSLGTRMVEQNEPITVNAIIPGMVPTSILSDEIVHAVPKGFRTPISLIVQVIGNIIDDSSITGQAIECSGSEIRARPPLPFMNEAAEFTAGGKYKESLEADAVLKVGTQAGERFDHI